MVVHDMEPNEYTAVLSKELSKHEDRWVIINTITNEILDDAQGYGYRSAEKAYASFHYKGCDPAKFTGRVVRRRNLKHWLENNPDFVRDLNQTKLDYLKGMYGPCEKFTTDTIREILKEHDLKVDYTADEIMDVWRKGK